MTYEDRVKGPLPIAKKYDFPKNQKKQAFIIRWQNVYNQEKGRVNKRLKTSKNSLASV